MLVKKKIPPIILLENTFPINRRLHFIGILDDFDTEYPTHV